jgi:hypothetical protein
MHHWSQALAPIALGNIFADTVLICWPGELPGYVQDAGATNPMSRLYGLSSRSRIQPLPLRYMKDMSAIAVQANFAVQVQTTMFFSQPTQQALAAR